MCISDDRLRLILLFLLVKTPLTSPGSVKSAVRTSKVVSARAVVPDASRVTRGIRRKLTVARKRVGSPARALGDAREARRIVLSNLKRGLHVFKKGSSVDDRDSWTLWWSAT